MSNEIQREFGSDWIETFETMDVEMALGEFIDEFREELEAITEEVSPVEPFIQSLLDRRDRGEIEC